MLVKRAGGKTEPAGGVLQMISAMGTLDENVGSEGRVRLVKAIVAEAFIMFPMPLPLCPDREAHRAFSGLAKPR